MKKFFVLILAILSTSVLSQQSYNSLKVKDFTNTNTAVFNTLLTGVAKLNAGVLSASPIVNADVSASAALAYSKFASLATGQVLLGNAGVPKATTLSGGATVGATGVVTLGNSAVITQLLTGYTAGAGTVSSADSVLGAIQKIDGNDQLKIAKSLVVAKGDLIGATASATPSPVSVGNDGEFLRANSGNAKGLSYSVVKEDLSSMDQFQGYESIGTWSTGNNANVMGGGTINGALANDTSFPYKYTHGASSLNDYWCSPAKSVGINFKNTTVYIPVPFIYNGSTSDIQVSVYDVTNTTVLQNFYPVSLSSQLTPYTQIISGAFGSSTNSYRICFQVKAANSGKIINYGPLATTKSLSSLGTIQGITSQNSFIFQSATFGLADITGTLTSSTGAGIYTYNSATGIYTALKSANIIGSASFTNSGAASSEPIILKGATLYSISSAPATLGLRSTSSASFPVVAGDTWKVANNNSNSTSAQWISFTAIAQSTDIASPSQQVSTDTMTFAFKATAIVDADPIGTYNTYSYAINSNTSTICGTAPTTLPSTNGIFMVSRPYSAASNCSTSVARYYVKIGKNLKNVEMSLFLSAGKLTPLMIGLNTVSSTTAAGSTVSYVPSTGILEINTGYSYSAGITARYIDPELNSNQGYFVINASITPSIVAIPFPSKVYASYTGSPPTGTVAASYNKVTFGTKIEDTHNAYSSGTYTVPEDGMYSIVGAISLSGSFVNGSTVGCAIFINGANGPTKFEYVAGSIPFVYSQISPPAIKLRKGDQVEIRPWGSTGSYTSFSTVNFFQIIKVSEI